MEDISWILSILSRVECKGILTNSSGESTLANKNVLVMAKEKNISIPKTFNLKSISNHAKRDGTFNVDPEATVVIQIIPKQQESEIDDASNGNIYDFDFIQLTHRELIFQTYCVINNINNSVNSSHILSTISPQTLFGLIQCCFIGLVLNCSTIIYNFSNFVQNPVGWFQLIDHYSVSYVSLSDFMANHIVKTFHVDYRNFTLSKLENFEIVSKGSISNLIIKDLISTLLPNGFKESSISISISTATAAILISSKLTLFDQSIVNPSYQNLRNIIPLQSSSLRTTATFKIGILNPNTNVILAHDQLGSVIISANRSLPNENTILIDKEQFIDTGLFGFITHSKSKYKRSVIISVNRLLPNENTILIDKEQFIDTGLFGFITKDSTTNNDSLFIFSTSENLIFVGNCIHSPEIIEYSLFKNSEFIKDWYTINSVHYLVTLYNMKLRIKNSCSVHILGEFKFTPDYFYFVQNGRLPVDKQAVKLIKQNILPVIYCHQVNLK
ncbi:hypothetical protein O9G_003779 [Rozella allomycis CSF55]|uniref:Uncharacterized protein n=1 Tax=Rozella allomycis (strain CSF55) TaxID=988480 RepID=A0A075B270_ROZAC|nr:hypothetical protein O9G_003779 [Rozella allomycis CSF55]|eukprot:EPZ36665.1 hypothetical protein O9G_003779 [Rozella allomycis CSF55]